MNFFKSHFSYDKRQRNGIFFLLLIILILQAIYFFVDFSEKDETSISNEKMIEFQNELDSLRLVEIEKNNPTIYPFNPNFITDFKGYQMGMSVEEIDRLFEFRNKDKYVNSAEEFQNVTLISDSLLNVISPYFKFPNWVNSTKTIGKSSIHNNGKVHNSAMIGLNVATEEDLIKIKGIGQTLALRIVKYRSSLKGFSLNDQLYEVWNLDSLVVKRVLNQFQVLDPPKIEKINVNEASFKELLSIVYVDYELTKKIFNYKKEVAEIQSIDELKKIDGFPLEKFDRIALYLRAK